jgi:hypothetical protein
VCDLCLPRPPRTVSLSGQAEGKYIFNIYSYSDGSIKRLWTLLDSFSLSLMSSAE